MLPNHLITLISLPLLLGLENHTISSRRAPLGNVENDKVGLSAEELGHRGAVLLDGEVGGRPLLVAGDFLALGALGVGDEQQVVAVGAGARGELAELPLKGSVAVAGPHGHVGQPERR